MKLGQLSNFFPYYSATYTRQYLTEAYSKQNISQPKSKSYQVSYSFMYHLQHGQLYFEQAKKSPTELKPMLLFYGLIQLIKSCILTTDPMYPENSQVLAHGVTARKRKKSNYCFLDDEVKIQRYGLFPHFMEKLFHMKHIDGAKYRMDTLLKHVADLHPLFLQINQKDLSFQGSYDQNNLIFSSDVLDHYYMTPNRFEQYLESSAHSTYNSNNRIIEEGKLIRIPLTRLPSPLISVPWLLNADGTVHLLKQKEDSDACTLPELAIHFLILYNLSMISRYEAEWWGELIHTFDGTDLPFILNYLLIAQEKVISIISYFLNEHMK